MSFRVPVTNYNLSTTTSERAPARRGRMTIEPQQQQYMNELFLSSINSGSANRYVYEFSVHNRTQHDKLYGCASMCVCFYVSETTCKCMTTNHTHTLLTVSIIFSTHAQTERRKKRMNWEHHYIHLWHNGEKMSHWKFKQQKNERKNGKEMANNTRSHSKWQIKRNKRSFVILN